MKKINLNDIRVLEGKNEVVIIAVVGSSEYFDEGTVLGIPLSPSDAEKVEIELREKKSKLGRCGT